MRKGSLNAGCDSFRICTIILEFQANIFLEAQNHALRLWSQKLWVFSVSRPKSHLTPKQNEMVKRNGESITTNQIPSMKINLWYSFLINISTLPPLMAMCIFSIWKFFSVARNLWSEIFMALIKQLSPNQVTFHRALHLTSLNRVTIYVWRNSNWIFQSNTETYRTMTLIVSNSMYFLHERNANWTVSK